MTRWAGGDGVEDWEGSGSVYPASVLWESNLARNVGSYDSDFGLNVGDVGSRVAAFDGTRRFRLVDRDRTFRMEERACDDGNDLLFLFFLFFFRSRFH